MKRSLGHVWAMVLLGAIMLPAEAGLLCATPQGYLVFCCPKPCPVIDSKRLGSEILRVLRNRYVLDAEEQQKRETEEMRRVLGRAGQRVSAMRGCTGTRPAGGLMEVGLAQRSVAVQGSSGGPVVEVQRLRQRSVADASELHGTLAAALSAQSEQLAVIGEAVSQARDVRDLVRRIAEMRIVIAKVEQIRLAVQAADIRQRRAEEILPQERRN